MSLHFNPVVTREEWARAHEIREQLHREWPQCFAGKGKSKRPLKLGIHTDILCKLNLDPRELSLALHDYTRGPTYLRNMVDGMDRIGLNGEPCGRVDERSASYSAGRLRKAMERKAKRAKAPAPSHAYVVERPGLNGSPA